MDIIIKDSYIPVSINYNGLNITLYVAQYLNNFYININNICDKKLTLDRWKKIKNSKQIINNFIERNKSLKPILTFKLYGTWMIDYLFEDFGNWWCAKNSSLDTSVNDFGLYIKNNINNLYNSQKKIKNPFFKRIQNHLIRSNQNNFINLSDISNIYEKDIRLFKKTPIYKDYNKKNPSHCLSDSKSVNEMGIRTTWAHPKLAIKYIEYIDKKNSNPIKNDIQYFIQYHLNIISGTSDSYTNEQKDTTIVQEEDEKDTTIVQEEDEKDTTITNPVQKLNLMNLTPDDFKDIRITPDGLFSVYDAIAKFKECSKSTARNFIDFEAVQNLVSFKFEGRGQQKTPVASFNQLLQILSELPGKQAKVLRREQAEISNMVLEGKREMVNEIMDIRHPIVEEEEKDTITNPVKKLNLMNLTPDDFKDVRHTTDGLFCITDCIDMISVQNSNSNASRKWLDRQIEKSPQWTFVIEHKFLTKNGKTGKPVKCCSFKNILKILSKHPSSGGRIICDEQAEISTMVLDGKREQVNEIMDIRHPIVEEEKDTTITNPVQKLNLMNLTPDDFKDIRITPDGLFSVYDAISKFKGCNIKIAKITLDRLKKDETTKCCFIFSTYSFKRSDGRRGKPIPVASFNQLLQILSQLPGKQAKVLRREQAEISTRAIAGDEDLEEAVREQRNKVSESDREVLMNGLESSSDRKRLIGIDMLKHKGVSGLYLYNFERKEDVECDFSEVENKEEDRLYYGFGVTSHPVDRYNAYRRDKDFNKVQIIKYYPCKTMSQASDMERRCKDVLYDLGIQIKYGKKVECFIANREELEIIDENISEIYKYENTIYNRDEINIELEKFKIKKEIEIEKEIEIRKMYCEMFEKGFLTFEQLKELVL